MGSVENVKMRKFGNEEMGRLNLSEGNGKVRKRAERSFGEKRP